jgi:hypothetical protein
MAKWHEDRSSKVDRFVRSTGAPALCRVLTVLAAHRKLNKEAAMKAAMRMEFVATLFSVLVGCLVASRPALAQQKTVKECQSAWQADKAGNQAKGITEKAYVDQCRAGVGSAATQPAATPAAPKPAPTVAAPVSPTSKPAVAPPAVKPAPAAATTLAGANQFSTEVQAKTRCPVDTVVWANPTSKIYHFSGHKDYGTTKEGAYMCEKDAIGQGVRAARNEKHP